MNVVAHEMMVNLFKSVICDFAGNDVNGQSKLNYCVTLYFHFTSSHLEREMSTSSANCVTFL